MCLCKKIDKYHVWYLHDCVCFVFTLTFSKGLAAAVQLNQYLEENAIIQLDQKAGKDQEKFQVGKLNLTFSVKNTNLRT